MNKMSIKKGDVVVVLSGKLHDSVPPCLMMGEEGMILL